MITQDMIANINKVAQSKLTHFYAFMAAIGSYYRHEVLRATYMHDGLMMDVKDKEDGQEYIVEVRLKK
jgi:hypothetical protein